LVKLNTNQLNAIIIALEKTLKS
jgi:hypothetical protein